MGFLFDDPLEDKNKVEETPFTDVAQQDPPSFETMRQESEQWKQEQADQKKRIENEANRPEDGIFTDIGHGLASGLVRGGRAVAQTAEWMAPEGSSIESGAKEVADYLKALHDDHNEWFAESKASQEARQSSAWNPRGWLYGGMESLSMLAPGMAVGLVNPIAGTATVGAQFWGSTAQQNYDQAVADEKKGIGKKLTESEKVAYANITGFWEGGLEMLQSRLPFLELGRFMPKGVVKNIVKSTVKAEGNPLWNSAKHIIETISSEVPMELLQEYAGQKTQYEFGQSKVDPGWDDIKGIIGGTIVMSVVLSGASQAGSASERKKLHDTLTGENVDPKDRAAAVQAVYLKTKEKDPELAKLWLAQTKTQLENNRPVALPLDEEIRNKGEQQAEEAQLAQPQEGIDKLKEAKQVELEQKQQRMAAREAAAAADHAQTPEGQPGKQAAEQLQSQTEPAKKGEPNANGVIEFNLEESNRNIQTVEKTLSNAEDLFSGMDESNPRYEQTKRAITELKAERDTLIKQQETAQATNAATESAKPSTGVPLTEQRTEAAKPAETAEPAAAKPATPAQAARRLVDMGAEKIVDGAETTWEIDTPDGRISIPQEGNDALSVYEQAQAALGKQTEENVQQEGAQAAESPKLDTGEAKPAEFSQQITNKNLKRDKKSGNLVFTDPETKAELQIYNETKPKGGRKKGWYRVNKNGEDVFLGNSKAVALKTINDNNTNVAEKSIKDVENKPKTKYSEVKSGDLHVEESAIPDDIKITTTVTQAETGANIEAEMSPKEAFKFIDSSKKMLANILECVTS